MLNKPSINLGEKISISVSHTQVKAPLEHKDFSISRATMCTIQVIYGVIRDVFNA